MNCSDYATVLNVPRYSYNNIIIITTNVIILELMSARFVHPGTAISLFQLELEQKNNEPPALIKF